MIRSIAKRLPLFLATAATTVLLSASALAADPAPGAATAATAAGGTDHEKVVGKLGFGWYGVSEIPVATGFTVNGTNVTLNKGSAVAPAVGVRYWLSDMLGIDGALGLVTTSGSTETKAANTTTTVDKPSQFGLLLHAGVPLALATTGPHLTFLVTPELNVGFASGTIKAQNQPDVDLSGFLLNVGARAGAEIQFGFMGLPQLALEGSIGLFFQTSSQKASTKVNNSDVSVSDSNTIITTSSFNQPWDFFRSTVAARYYFF